jgi:hypothetical protein
LGHPGLPEIGGHPAARGAQATEGSLSHQPVHGGTCGTAEQRSKREQPWLFLLYRSSVVPQLRRGIETVKAIRSLAEPAQENARADARPH